MSGSDKICLGAVVGVHGIKGEVKLKSFTQKPKDIDKYGILEDKSGNKYDLKVVGQSKELLRGKIKGIDDRTKAETLIGIELYVNKDLLPGLKDEDEFYHADLIGLKVVKRHCEERSDAAISSESIGTVVGIYNFGAGDILEIKLKDAKNTEMLPFTKEYFPYINIKDGYIIIESVSLNFAEDAAEDES